jgi:glycosyltransferase involved in cell wall biosynthesis
MKIVYLITGSGGSFYCGNCYRDMIYLNAIRKANGTVATAIPLYLPPDESVQDNDIDRNVFFGAISLYVREKIPFLRNMPDFLEKFLDSPKMLRMAAKRAGTTRTEGMEDMTINMITGEKAFPEKELDRLTGYLDSSGKPDIIHLSNALVIGLAHQIRRKMDIKIVCSILNEDDWINDMAEPWQSQAWNLIAREADAVDAFVTPSSYYKDFFVAKTGVNPDKIHIVPMGLDPGLLPLVQNKATWPALGYFCRVNAHNGFDKLVDAFIRLRTENRLPGLTLHVSGGYTGDDKPFLMKQLKKVRKAGLENTVKIYSEFIGPGKQEFFSSIDLMSVPVRKYDGYGLYLLEANAAGVPVVQPPTGAFPEIIQKTGGGLIYERDDIGSLAAGIESLMKNRDLLASLSKRGREKVLTEVTLQKMSDGLSAVYNLIKN